MKKLLAICCIAAIFCVPLFFRTTKESEEKPTVSTCITTVIVNDQELPLEQYVMGVIAAEMPASYNLEALKAQAIASRTYAIYKLKNEVQQLDASTKHQVFYSASEREEKWQDDFNVYEQKIKEAVSQTKGQIITYKDAPISAMFHAASNGQTESAKNYSGHEIAYLQSVESPETEQVKQQVKIPWTQQQLTKMTVTRNDTGRVEQVSVAGKTFSGREVREMLHLRSTDFSLKFENGAVVATTKGYGHGVGMSQQGANIYAEEGWSASKILAHYYRSTKIQQFVCQRD